MTPALDHVFDEVRGAWRFRWFALALLRSSWHSSAGLWCFALPDRYEADARVFVDTRTALKPALQGLTIDQNVDAQINYVRQSLLEGPQLEQIAKETGVLPPIGYRRARAAPRFSIDLSDRIALTVSTPGIKATNAAPPAPSTASTTWMSSRERSLQRGRDLAEYLRRETLGGKREGSEHAQKFLETQIKDYEQRLSARRRQAGRIQEKECRPDAERSGRLFCAAAKRSRMPPRRPRPICRSP